MIKLCFQMVIFTIFKKISLIFELILNGKKLFFDCFYFKCYQAMTKSLNLKIYVFHKKILRGRIHPLRPLKKICKKSES